MLRNRAKRKYGTVAQEIQFSEFYRTAITPYIRSSLYAIYKETARTLRCTARKELILQQNKKAGKASPYPTLLSRTWVYVPNGAFPPQHTSH